ncbi:MAG: glycosyltransferase family 2 protein [Bacteroidales bacterium]
MNNNALIDIGIICYNHEKLIQQCVESVLSQKTDFPYRIFIIDDCSDDETPGILRRLKNKHKDKIHLELNTQNKGVIENAKKLSELFTATYCCWMDADDFWTYSSKLQTQVDFLETHKEYAGCFHDASIISSVDNSDSKMANRSHQHHKMYSQANLYKPDIYPSDIINRIIVPTASLVYRNTDIAPMIQRIGISLSLSWIIHLEIIKNSRFRYFNACWSAYRDHPQGYSKKFSLVDYKLQIIKVLKYLLSDAYYKHNKAAVYESLASEYYHLIEAMHHENQGMHEIKKHIRAFKSYHKQAGKFIAEELKKHAE